MKAASTTSQAASLVEWLDQAVSNPMEHSIVVGSKCPADIESIGAEVAGYLNEFDDAGAAHWRAFNTSDFRHLAGDPAYRDLIIDDLPDDPAFDEAASDLDRIIRHLGTLGGAVLEGQASLDAARGLTNTFHVCLCCTEHTDPENCHMWLNPERFARDSLVSVIADSFLDWASRVGSHGSGSAPGGSRPPASPR